MTGMLERAAKVTPREDHIRREIEAEFQRQGYAPNWLEPNQRVDAAKLAHAIEVMLHG